MNQLEHQVHQLRAEILLLKQHLEGQPTVAGFIQHLAKQPTYKTGYSVYDSGYKHGLEYTLHELKEYFSVPT